MSNSTVNLPVKAYGRGPRNVTLPVKGGAHIFSGTLVAQILATAMLVPGSTAASGPAIGVASFEQDNTSGADGDLRCEVQTDGIFLFTNGGDVSEATLLGSALHMSDDHTVYVSDSANTRKRAGFFMGMEPGSSGLVRVFVTGLPVSSSATSGSGVAGDQPTHAVRYMTTGNIADLAAFTVAQDGVTGVQNDRVFLPKQTTASQNGIYVLGAVSGGACALTRAADFDAATTAEIESGVIVGVSEGTTGADTMWQLTTNAPITVGTTALAFSQLESILATAVGQVARVTVVQTATVPQAIAYGALNLASTDAVTGALAGTNMAAATSTTAGSQSAAQFLQTSHDHEAPGTALTDADQTVLVSAGYFRTCATLTADRVKTISATGAVAGDLFWLTRTSVDAQTLTVKNSAGTTLLVMPNSKVGFCILQFTTDWVLKASTPN